jgi:hypothetical protein
MANEPVAWHYPDGRPDQCTTDKAYAEKDPAWTPMYYKHEWVGLTVVEVDKMIFLMGFPPDWTTENAIVRAIVRNLEAKLKEKNND